MHSKALKIVTGIEKFKRPIQLNHKKLSRCRFAIYKGYEPHFQWFDNHLQDYHQSDDFYCIDKASVDLALEMAHRKVRQLTYISSRNYETVMALSKNSLSQLQADSQKQLFPKVKPNNIEKKCSTISNQTSNAALHILKNYNFIIKTGYLDVHPLGGYEKMCGYLYLKPNSSILNLFDSFQCSQKPLFDSFILLPILKQMRETFLVTEGLKARHLQRRQGVKITSEIIDSYMSKWRNKIDFTIAENAYSTFSQSTKLNWIIDNQLGVSVSKDKLIEGKYRHYYYATWN